MNYEKLEKFDTKYFKTLNQSGKEEYMRDFIDYTLNKKKKEEYKNGN